MQAIQLPKSSLSSLSGHKKQWIVCEQGVIWLSDDGHDVILQRGQKWQVRSDATVVIEAFSHSRFNIQETELRADNLLKQVQQYCDELLHQFIHKPAIKSVNI